VVACVYDYHEASAIAVFWIHSANKARFEQDYRRLAKLVGLPGHDDSKLDIRPIVRDWLEGPESGDWILVLDNADNKLDFFPEGKASSMEIEPESDGLAQFVPRRAGNKGTLLVTTRDREVAYQLTGGNVLSKAEMGPEEAKQLFAKYYPATTTNHQLHGESILGLVEAVCYLPLAIVQVAAFLQLNPAISPSLYLERFNSARTEQHGLLSNAVYDIHRNSSDTAETVLTTFSITFRQIQEQSHLASSLLKIIACIDRQGVSLDFLARSGAVGAEDSMNLGQAISKLINFALLTPTECGQSYDMHSLVHLSIRASLPPQERQRIAESTAEALKTILPHGEHEYWHAWRAHLPHALALVDNIQMDSISGARLCARISFYLLLALGHDSKAETLFRKSLELSSAMLRPDDPDTLIFTSGLAATFRQQGRWKEAEELEARVLETSKRVLGQEHPNTLTSMNNLASTFSKQGRWKEAEELCRRRNRGRQREKHGVAWFAMPDLGTGMRHATCKRRERGRRW
jgi:hypothetical protein